MKRVSLKLFFLLLPLLLLLSSYCIGEGLSGALPGNFDGSERILAFHSEITVHEDASMTVIETIKVRAAGSEIKRGIYRDFPIKYKYMLGLNYIVRFDVIEVLRDGKPEPHFTEKLSNGIRLYIGQSDLFLDPGDYSYTITYQTDRQLHYDKSFDELYWNVTGNGWSFPIEFASAVVILPHGASQKVINHAAYTGRFGSNEANYRYDLDRYGNPYFVTTGPLNPYEGLTIAVSWPKGYVRQPGTTEQIWLFVRGNLGMFIAVFGLLGIFLYYLATWTKVGADPPPGNVFPLYHAPEGLSPAAARYIKEMGFDHRAFTAALIDMAVKKTITIEEKGSRYTITRIANPEDLARLTKEELGIFNKLLGTRTSFTFDDEAYATVQGALAACEAPLESTCRNTYFVTNSSYMVTGGLASVLVVIPGIIEMFVNGNFNFITVISGVSLLILLIVFVNLMKSPTAAGRRVLDKIDGFKMFMEISEKDRLNAVYPLEKTPQLFEAYLPFALALGVEQAWAQQFSTVFAQLKQAGTEYAPTWYYGSHWDSMNTGRFVSSVGSSLSSAVSSSSTAPSSSSGSGGGGSSGGGGGGGGGGGW